MRNENIYIPLTVDVDLRWVNREITIDITDITAAYEKKVAEAFAEVAAPDKDEVYQALKKHMEFVLSDVANSLIERIMESICMNDIKREVAQKVSALADEKVSALSPYIVYRVEAAKDNAFLDRYIFEGTYKKVMRLSQKYNVKQMMKDAVREEVSNMRKEIENER